MKIIAILLSLPAILFAEEEMILSPLFNCFVENFSPSKGTTTDWSEGMEGILGCLEESLEVTTAEMRSLSELWKVCSGGCGGNFNYWSCLPFQNATIVVEKFLDLRISKVSINFDGLNTFQRPDGLEGGGFIKVNHRVLVYDCWLAMIRSCFLSFLPGGGGGQYSHHTVQELW